MNVSKDLGWNNHINKIAASANSSLELLKRNVQTKNKDIRTLAYNSLARPQVEYGSAVWSPYTKENKHKTEMVQRRAARQVSNDYSTYSSVTEMMSNLGWRSLENRCYDICLWMFYKIVYGLAAIPVPSYFERPEVYTSHTQPLAYKHNASVTINTLFSPWLWFCGTDYQLISSSILILTPSKRESERSILNTHSKGYTVFNLLLAPLWAYMWSFLGLK